MERRRLLAILFFFVAAFSLPSGGVTGDIYICRRSNGVPLFTKNPADCRYSVSPPFPTRFAKIIRSTSERYGVDPHLVRSIIKVESDFNPRARSPKGARGLMQLMPATARQHNVVNIYNPKENIEGGVRHLRLLLDHFRGEIPLTLAAYNAGVKAVKKYGGVPPFGETRRYVRRVLAYYRGYRWNRTRNRS